MAITIAAFVVSLGFGSRANAWGMLRALNTKFMKSYLAYSIYKYHRINYCLDIESGSAGHFHKRTLDTEVKWALGQWLEVVRQYTGPVPLNSVQCASPNLNIMVYVGPSTRDDFDPSYNDAHIHDLDEYFVKIVLNSDFRYRYDGSIYPVYDFAYVVRQFLNSGNFSLSFFLKEMYANKYSFDEIAAWVAPQWGADGKAILYYTSAHLLLHELGHSFGLCDTYDVTQNCDPNFSSHWNNEPPSVMGMANYLYLSPDDIEGIRALFQRFAPISRTPEHKRK